MSEYFYPSELMGNTSEVPLVQPVNYSVNAKNYKRLDPLREALMELKKDGRMNGYCQQTIDVFLDEISLETASSKENRIFTLQKLKDIWMNIKAAPSEIARRNQDKYEESHPEYRKNSVAGTRG